MKEMLGELVARTNVRLGRLQLPDLEVFMDVLKTLHEFGLDQGCDCGTAAHAADTAAHIRDLLRRGLPVGDYPWVLQEQMDDVLSCARRHFEILTPLHFARRVVGILCDLATREELATHLRSTPAKTPTAGAARRLTSVAVRVLPPGDRDRYRDEFRSELHELAVAGASGWAQVAYAMRQLDLAWVLRAELRTAAKQVRS